MILTFAIFVAVSADPAPAAPKRDPLLRRGAALFDTLDFEGARGAYERALSVRPKLPIIATSGFSEDSEAAVNRDRVFLQKPFDLDQLTAALRQALGGHV